MNIALIIPEYLYHDKAITDGPHNRDNCLDRLIKLKEKLVQNGHVFHTIDYYSSGKIDCLIVYRIDANFRAVLRTIRKNPFVYIIHIMNEPPVVVPMHIPEIINTLPIDMNFTWDDDVIKTQKNYKKITEAYERILPEEISINEFSRLKFITTIASNKQSKGKGELYSERIRAIEFFSSTPEGFDLYGMGWNTSTNKKITAVYKGTVEKKIDVLNKYKFCLSYENTSDHDGYICEKIFDCFRAGCVPIYYGAKNITSYIPGNCFIDFRNFGSYEELYNYLLRFNETDYQNYLSAIKKFFVSDKYHMFTSESHVQILSEEIESLREKEQKKKTMIAIKKNLVFNAVKNGAFFMKNIFVYKRFLFDSFFS